jgi:hypothetical protein
MLESIFVRPQTVDRIRALFLHSLDSVATIRRLVVFYVHEHNHVHAWRPTDRRPARRARHSTRPHDPRADHRSDHGPRALVRSRRPRGEPDRARSQRVRGAEPCPGSDPLFNDRPLPP